MALKSILRTVLATALVLPLAACGTGREDPLVLAFQGVTGGLFGDEEDAAAAAQPVFTAATVPPELVAQAPVPLILVEVPAAEGSTSMTRVGQNGPNATWRAPNGLGLALDANAVMISTRGTGFDLMASDVRPTSAALDAQREGEVDRAMTHLDGQAQQVRHVYDCYLHDDGLDTVVIAGAERRLTRMTETCRGRDGYRFENIYWVDRAGRAIHSRQWVSPEVGSFRITILRD